MYYKDLATKRLYRSKKDAPADADLVPYRSWRYPPIINMDNGNIYPTIGIAAMNEGYTITKMTAMINEGIYFSRLGRKERYRKRTEGIADDLGNVFSNFSQLAIHKNVTEEFAIRCVREDPQGIFRDAWCRGVDSVRIRYSEHRWWINDSIPCVTRQSLLKCLRRLIGTVDILKVDSAPKDGSETVLK